MISGILLVDKPAGWTSHDVVAKVRSNLRQANSQKPTANSSRKKLSANSYQPAAARLKVGHTGTLDPFATGLLVLVVGSYTKRAGEFSKMDKTYEAELTLGATSTTGDTEGKITQLSAFRRSSEIVPKIDKVRAVLGQFEGGIMQTPHPYSAIKIKGQRAYKMSRQGKEVKLEPRKVKVYRLEVLGYRYPKLKIITRVSSGTYIRSLAEDIGQKLGTGAYLSALRRIKVGDFGVKDAQDLQNLDISAIMSSLSQDRNA